MTDEVIVIFKKQILEILKYKLTILPPLIPDGFVLFTYNRVVNLNNCNIIQEIENDKFSNWSADELFKILLELLDRFGIPYVLENDLLQTKNSFQIKDKIQITNKKPSHLIRKYIKTKPLWAINYEQILPLPEYLIICNYNYNHTSPREYIKALIQRSYAIRNHLRTWTNRQMISRKK